MSNEENTTSLSTMLGSGNEFKVKEKLYVVKPIALKDVESFMVGNISMGAQLYNLTNKKNKDKVDRWLGGIKDKDGTITTKGYCYDSEGNPVTLDVAMNDDWDVVDLKNFFQKLCDISG